MIFCSIETVVFVNLKSFNDIITMKSLVLFLMAVLLGIARSWVCNGAEFLDGRAWKFGKWSQRMVTKLPSSMGDSEVYVQFVTVSLVAVHAGPGQLETRTMKLVRDHSGKLLWIGPADAFLVKSVNGVMGIFGGMNTIRVLRNAKDMVEGQFPDSEEGAETYLNRSSDILDIYGKKYEQIDPAFVFGIDVIRPSSLGSGDLAEIQISDLKAVPVGWQVSWHNVDGRILSMTFDDALMVQDAAIDGKPVVLSRDARRPSELVGWGAPRSIVFPSDHPGMSAMSCFADLEVVDPNGRPKILGVRSVVLSDGNIWCGPAPCWLALIEGQIIGFMIGLEQRSLQVYLSGFEKIPVGLDYAVRVEQRIGAFETTVKSRGLLPSREFSLKELSKGAPELGGAVELRIKGVRVEMGRAVLNLGSEEPDGEYTVTVPVPRELPTGSVEVSKAAISIPTSIK